MGRLGRKGCWTMGGGRRRVGLLGRRSIRGRFAAGWRGMVVLGGDIRFGR